MYLYCLNTAFLLIKFLEKISEYYIKDKREEAFNCIKNIEMLNFTLFQYMLSPGNKIYSVNQVFWLYQREEA